MFAMDLERFSILGSAKISNENKFQKICFVPISTKYIGKYNFLIFCLSMALNSIYGVINL